jgi:hypothetical protein
LQAQSTITGCHCAGKFEAPEAGVFFTKPCPHERLTTPKRIIEMAYRRIPKTSTLTEDQITALRDVSHGKSVSPLISQRLANLGLIEQSPGGWIVTHQGQIRLMFRDAR